MDLVYTPFTDDQVKSIQDYHAAAANVWWLWLVCDKSVSGSHGPLDVNEHGLGCIVCTYRQDWAPRWLTDMSWTKRRDL